MKKATIKTVRKIGLIIFAAIVDIVIANHISPINGIGGIESAGILIGTGALIVLLSTEL